MPAVLLHKSTGKFGVISAKKAFHFIDKPKKNLYNVNLIIGSVFPVGDSTQISEKFIL